MKKVRFGMGGIMMIAALMISDRAAIIGIYMLAAAWHEIGHLIAAKLMKIDVEEIRFGFSGVRIVTDARLTSYKREIMLAFAGPLMNMLAFGAACVTFGASGRGIESLFECAASFLRGGADIWGVVGFFALASLIQAIMNLLPVNTFDGGRMIYCFIAQRFSQYAAERVLSVLSAFSAFFLWTLALYLMLRISSGLGIFVFAACIFASTRMENGEN